LNHQNIYPEEYQYIDKMFKVFNFWNAGLKKLCRPVKAYDIIPEIIRLGFAASSLALKHIVSTTIGCLIYYTGLIQNKTLMNYW